MTDIEQKALSLVNATFLEPHYEDWAQVPQGCISKALIRAIEQHEAFRQEVSDVCESLLACTNANKRYGASLVLNRFIIAKPDPLVEAMQEWWDADGYASIDTFRAAIEKRGGKIVWGEG